MVPVEPGGDGERAPFDDIDDLVNPLVLAPAQVSSPAVVTRPLSPSVSRGASKPVPEPLPHSDDERPLFERDLDAVLGVPSHTPGEEPNRPKSTHAAGMDALSLGSERNQIVISSQKATALAVAVVILLALAFGAGFLLASR
jgi:hypothetical protein